MTAHRRNHVTSVPTSVSTMCFRTEIIFIFKGDKIPFLGSHDKQNLTVVSWSFHMKFMKFAEGVFHKSVYLSSIVRLRCLQILKSQLFVLHSGTGRSE